MAKLVKIVSWRKFLAVQYSIIGDTCLQVKHISSYNLYRNLKSEGRKVVIAGMSMYYEHAIYLASAHIQGLR